MTCRACGAETLLVLDLGAQPPSNALLTHADDEENTYPLRLMRCPECCLLQTDVLVPPEELFNDSYPFLSGAVPGWGEHFRCLAGTLIERFNPSFVVDIGGNDGTLLREFDCRTLNVEPSGVAEVSRKAGTPTIQLRWEEYTGEKADLILGTNVLAHTPDLHGFVASVARNLKGTAVFEFPWALDMLQHGQFDTIYHEHYSYLSLTALMTIFERHGLWVNDAEHLSTHGGSLRIYVSRSKYLTADVGELASAEGPLWFDRIYREFRERAEVVRDTFRIRVRPGMYAYGAAAKGNTLLNWCGLTWKDIVAVGDSTPAKQGKYLPGSRIPIISEQEMIENDPKAVAILPWNWADGIIERLRPRLPMTEFVVP